MNVLRGRRARRLPALIASLALFVVGTNYCVLAGLGGDTGMACLSVAADAATSAVPACHRAASAKDDAADPPAPSCCPDPVVAPTAPSLDKVDVPTSLVAELPDASSAASALAIVTSRHGHPPPPDDRPPTRLARAPVPARAPPLA